MTRPRILHLFAVTALGGTELGALAYIRRQPDLAHHVLFIEPPGPATRLYDEAGVPTESLGTPLAGPAGPLRAYLRLRSALPALGPDLIHSYGLRPSLLVRFQRPRPPLVQSLHSIDTHRPPWQAYLDRETADRVDRYITNSGAGAQFLMVERGVQRAQVAVVPNGIDVEAFATAAARREAARAALGIDPHTVLILTVANLRPPKGLDVLAEAAARLASTVSPAAAHEASVPPRFVWLVAGDGPLAAGFAAQIARRGLARLVRPLGFRRDIPELMAAADLFCLTSRREGVPVSILEAMATGRAVVTTDVGGVSELVIAGETGVMVPPDDPAGLAAELAALVADAPRRAALGRAGQTRALNHFTLEKAATAIAAVYDELLAGGKSGTRGV